ncbi:MAG: outer membrane lipoprotein-sorting protein [Nevskiales bacterium]
MKRLWMLLAFALVLPAHAEEADKILNCMRGNVLPGSQAQELELSTTDITGATRTLKGKLFTTREQLPEADGLLRATLQITAPEHLVGAAYLLRQTEDRRFDSMYVYLPSVHRVRRVSTEFADGSLLGTNFSYYEFKQLTNAFWDLGPKVEPDAEVDNRDTHVVLFSARPNDTTAIYSSVRVWLDQKTCVPLKAEFYKGDALRKRFSAPAKALQKSGDHWYLTEMEMRDLLDDTRTVLRIVSMTEQKQLPSRLFDPNLFYRRE